MEKSRIYLGLETTISSRNQITIPLKLIKELDLHPGDKIRFKWMSASADRRRLMAEVTRKGRRLISLRILLRLRRPTGL